MRIGIGNTVPERSNLPGQSGGVPVTSEFIFEVNAAVGNTIDLTTRNNGSAADFIINWGEGSDETVNASTASHTYTSSGTKVIKINKAGTNTPVNEFNVLATNQGRSMVTKISNWGTTEWYRLRDAFNSCTNLTLMESESELLTASNASTLFYNTFKNCTSLTNIDMSNWATNNTNWYMRSTFQNCTNVSLVKAPSSRIMPVTYFGSTSTQQFNDSPFRYVGSTTASGATFEFEGLDFSNHPITAMTATFANCRINGNTSSFSNWTFNSNTNYLSNIFYLASVRGTNPTLDCSGWTTFQGTSLSGAFRGLSGNANLSLNLSNLNVSNVTNMNSMMGQNTSINSVANIIGLSTWGASQASSINMSWAFGRMRYLKLTADDNFSDAFMNSLSPTNTSNMFNRLGDSLSSPFGEPPNLASLDLSNSSSLNSMFYNSRLSNLPDFTNVSLPTSPADFNSFMRGIITNSVTSHLDFSNTTFKPSVLTRAFENFRSANKITFPSNGNSDFSSLTNISYAFNNAGSGSAELEVVLPTDADYSSVTSWVNAFNGLNGPGTDTLTTCVGDTLIRRLHATSLNTNQQALNLGSTKLTGSPSVVDSNVTDLETAGWTITSNSTDAVMPFVYATPFYADTPATPTGSFTGGTFSSSNSNIAVNATTGVINTPNAGNTTIRYTLADGCYNEQAIVVYPVLAQVNNVYSMEFDGTNDKIEVTDTINEFGFSNNEFSLSAWIRIDSNASQNGVIAKRNIGSSSANKMWYFETNTSSQLRFLWYNTLGGSDNASSTDTIPLNTWTHVVVTSDGSGTNGLNFYINGTPDSGGSKTSPSSSSSIQQTGTPLWIGARGGNSAAQYMDGKLDEVAVFNVELTAPEIQGIYLATETGKTADLDDLTTPPVAWYRMGD